MPNQKIAIVTSISYGDNNKDCFERGVRDGGFAAALPTIDPFHARGDYQHINTQVQNAVADNPNLIVTAGGVIAANAAAAVLNAANSKPYIYLAGIAPSAMGPTNKGGVILNTPAQNGARLQQLTGHCDLTKVYLVVNDNNPMEAGANSEAVQWGNNRVARFFAGIANPTAANVVQVLTQAVTALAASNPTPSGLVISSDPYFRLYRTELVKTFRADNTLKAVPICYPFKEHADADKSGHAYWLYKPQLSVPVATSSNADIQATGYYKLGLEAGKYLSTGANRGIITWDLNQNRWH
jgi:hypothetical protein